jgi:hypothetical protein
MPETASNQVKTLNTELFKSIADAAEEVCKVVWSKYRGMQPIGNIIDTAKRVLQEFSLVRTGDSQGQSNKGLEEWVAALLAFKALVDPERGCPNLPIPKDDRKKLVDMVDAMFGLIQDKELDVPRFDVPRDVVERAAQSLVSTAKLTELITKVLLLNVYRPLYIADLVTWASKGRLFASQDSKSRNYSVIIKIPNIFTGKTDEVVITLKSSTVRDVLIKREKYDIRKKKREGAEILKETPKVLANYLVDFLVRGWLPRFSSLAFVELVVRLVTEQGTVFNTPEEEARFVLTRAFSTFAYVKVSRDPNEPTKRLLEVKILTDLNSLVYVDEDAKEVLVPLKLYRTIEVKTTTKTAFTKRLLALGVLKTAHTTNSLWFGPNSHTELHIAIFDLEKLSEFLDVNPVDLMTPNLPRIDFQTVEEATEGDVDAQTEQGE